MFNIGGGEVIVIALIALIVLGPQRLPGAARQAGKVMGDLRRISTGFQNEIRTAFEDHERGDAAPTPPVTPAITPANPALVPSHADLTEAMAAVAAQAAPERKSQAKKPAATTTTKASAAGKKAAAKKAAVKKAPAKKAAAKKAPAKKAPAKKAATKKRSS